MVPREKSQAQLEIYSYLGINDNEDKKKNQGSSQSSIGKAQLIYFNINHYRVNKNIPHGLPNS